MARLAIILPTILPFAADEIHSEVRTGTAELLDELIPEDDDEDISVRTRDKSTMSVIIRIGDGDLKPSTNPKKPMNTRGKQIRNARAGAGYDMVEAEQIVFQEDDQEED